MEGRVLVCIFFFQAEDGIRDHCVTGVQTCALPIFCSSYLRRKAAAVVLRPKPGSPSSRAIHDCGRVSWRDRKSTRLNSSHTVRSYAVFFLKKKTVDSFC